MFARTESLRLRPAWREDAAPLETLIAGERRVRGIFAGTATCGVGADCAEGVCGHDPLLPRLLVFRRTAAAPELIGMAGLARAAGGDVELFFWTRRSEANRGYATEAARAVIGIARDGLRLKGLTARGKGRAQARVLEKLGFRDGRLSLAEGPGSGCGECDPVALQSRAA
jgi:RimJ/RimL family protein N-acetyltransferase